MDATTERVVEQMGLEVEADGMPRIAGRVLGYLLLSPEPRCLDRLAEDLLISKTSASTNARLLERLGVLERTSRPGDRRDFYGVSDDLHVRILAHRMERLRALRRVMDAALAARAAECAVVRRRVETYGEFFEHMLDVVRAARGRWEREHDHHAGSDDIVRAAG